MLEHLPLLFKPSAKRSEIFAVEFDALLNKYINRMAYIALRSEYPWLIDICANATQNVVNTFCILMSAMLHKAQTTFNSLGLMLFRMSLASASLSNGRTHTAPQTQMHFIMSIIIHARLRAAVCFQCVQRTFFYLSTTIASINCNCLMCVHTRVWTFDNVITLDIIKTNKIKL